MSNPHLESYGAIDMMAEPVLHIEHEIGSWTNNLASDVIIYPGVNEI